MSENTTSIALTSKQKQALVSSIEKQLSTLTKNNLLTSWAVAERLYSLYAAGVHKEPKMSFDKWIEGNLNTFGNSAFTLRRWKDAYSNALQAGISREEMPKWNQTALYTLTEKGGMKLFPARVKSGEITAEIFDVKMAKALNDEAEDKPNVISLYCLHNGAYPVPNSKGGFTLLTEEEVKAEALKTEDKSEAVIRSTFKTNLDKRVIVYSLVNKANLSVIRSEFWKETTDKDIEAFLANQAKKAKEKKSRAEVAGFERKPKTKQKAKTEEKPEAKG